MLLALTVGCSSSSSSSGATGGSTTGGSPASGKTYKMTFIQGVAGDGFYVTMGCGIPAEAKKLGNVTVNIQGPSQFDATLQNPIIESVTAAKPDAILIAPNDVSASRPPIAQAMAAGIKVVLVDTTLTDPSGAVSQISSDNVAGGADAFTAIKQLVPGGGQVLVVNVKPGVSTTDQRQQGFATAAKAKPSSPTWACSSTRTARRWPPRSRWRRCRRIPASSASSRPTCSPRRARPPESARRQVRQGQDHRV